jgi:CDP-6-deoxy-D-xylo-4-hexulose-3-dehydrase
VKQEKRKVPVGSFVLGDEEISAVVDVLKSQRISEGPRTREFEKTFAEYIGTEHAVAVNSGTSALLVALLALIYDERFPRIKKGAKVITSPVTYAATANAIVLTGLEPVFLDIDPATFVIRPETIEEYLSGASDIEEHCMILPVHLMGYPNAMVEINGIADRYGLAVFEDSAQAHGSMVGDRRTGSMSVVADFSFYIAHNIQAGEMGAVTTSDRELAKLIRKLKANGRTCSCESCTRGKGVCPYSEHDFDPRFRHEYIGYNFKTMDIQAALALTQLKKAAEIFKKRQENVRELLRRLDFAGEAIALPRFDEKVSYMAFPMVLKGGSGFSREDVLRRLEAAGIESRPLFGCIPTQQPAFEFLKARYEGRLPNAEHVGKNGFYIGCHQYLGPEDFDQIESAFRSIFDA